MKKASRKGNVKMQSDKMARRWLAGGFAAAVAMAACTCLADAGMSKIDILPGEFWWGGEVLEGRNQPFSRESDGYDIDMRMRHGRAGGNQAAPLLLSSKGRWVWCEQAFRFSVANGTLAIETEKSAPVATGTAPGGTLRDAFLHCSRTFFPPKGHPQLRFFSEPIINTWISLRYNQNEREVLEIAESFVSNGVPPGVFMIDHTWHGDAFGDWDFNKARFHDPKGMVKKMNAMGYDVMLWFDPHITTDSPFYRQMRKDGLLLKDASGGTADSYWWAGKSAVIDCTNPRTFLWLKDTCNRLMKDYGVVGFFFDGGDAYNYDPEAVPFAKGATPSDQVRAFHMIGMEVPFQQHRASWKMGGLPLMQTLRDKYPTYEELLACVRDGIEAGLLGYPFVVFDLVGGGTVSNFEGANFKAAQEHFVRSMQVQALSPMVQFSLSPWTTLDARHQRIVRDMVALRQRWAPYIVQCAKDSGRTGEPIMRAMEYSYPGRGYGQVVDQFMMGDRLLVAPVVEKGAVSRKVALPPGRWKADDGQIYDGPATVEVATPLERLPHFEEVRQ